MSLSAISSYVFTDSSAEGRKLTISWLVTRNLLAKECLVTNVLLTWLWFNEIGTALPKMINGCGDALAAIQIEALEVNLGSEVLLD